MEPGAPSDTRKLGKKEPGAGVGQSLSRHLACLGPWRGLLSPPADAQAGPHTPPSASSRSCFLWSQRLQPPRLQLLHTPGQGAGGSTRISSFRSFPETFSALHCPCIISHLMMKSSPEFRENRIVAVFTQRAWRWALQPRVWLRPKSMLFALLLLLGARGSWAPQSLPGTSCPCAHSGMP